MRIIFLSAAKGFGGGEKYLSLIIPALRMKGYVAGISSTSENTHSRLNGLLIDVNTYKEGDIVVLNGIGSVYKYCNKLPKFVVKIFVQHSSLEDDQSSIFKLLFRPFLIKYFGKKLDLVIRVCKSSLPDNFFPIVRTVYNGTSFNHNYEFLKRNGSDFKLAMIGSLNENKNQLAALEFLIRAPSHISLKIIGDGPLNAQLRTFSIENNLESRVTFTGFVPEACLELYDCHALLILSRNEAFPFAAIEAMSLGLPVISTNVGGLPELINHGTNGYLFPKNDLFRLDEFILRLDSDEALRQRLALNARVAIKQGFTTEHMVDGFIEALSLVCNFDMIKLRLL